MQQLQQHQQGSPASRSAPRTPIGSPRGNKRRSRHTLPCRSDESPPMLSASISTSGVPALRRGARPAGQTAWGAWAPSCPRARSSHPPVRETARSTKVAARAQQQEKNVATMTIDDLDTNYCEFRPVSAASRSARGRRAPADDAARALLARAPHATRCRRAHTPHPARPRPPPPPRRTPRSHPAQATTLSARRAPRSSRPCAPSRATCSAAPTAALASSRTLPLMTATGRSKEPTSWGAAAGCGACSRTPGW